MDGILDHARSPYHRGHLADAAHVHTVRHPTCGDHVCLQLRIDATHGADDTKASGRVVTEAWFEGRGCVVSQAAASILCEGIEGRRLAELRGWTAEAFLATLGTPLTPARRGCALLAWQALQGILASLSDEDAPSAAAA